MFVSRLVSASDDGDRLRVLEKRLVRPETYLELIIVEFCPHLTMMLTAGTTSPLPHIHHRSVQSMMVINDQSNNRVHCCVFLI